MNQQDRNYCVAADVAFLLDMARHFEKRSSNGEDSEHWANVYNAQNCRRIASLLSPIDQVEAKHRAQEAAGEVWNSPSTAPSWSNVRSTDATDSIGTTDVTRQPDWTPDERTAAAVIDWFEEQYPHSVGPILARKHFLRREQELAQEFLPELSKMLEEHDQMCGAVSRDHLAQKIAPLIARWALSRGELK